jgi:hypothetical protein
MKTKALDSPQLNIKATAQSIPSTMFLSISPRKKGFMASAFALPKLEHNRSLIDFGTRTRKGLRAEPTEKPMRKINIMQIPEIYFYAQHLPKLYYLLFFCLSSRLTMELAALPFIVYRGRISLCILIPLASYLRVVIHNTRVVLLLLNLRSSKTSKEFSAHAQFFKTLSCCLCSPLVECAMAAIKRMFL